MNINYENISYYLVQTKGIMFIAQHCPSPADYPTYVLQYGPDPDCVTGLQHPDYITKSPDHPDYVTLCPEVCCPNEAASRTCYPYKGARRAPF